MAKLENAMYKTFLFILHRGLVELRLLAPAKKHTQIHDLADAMEKGGNMRGGRMLVILGIIVLVGAVAVVALLLIRGRQETPGLPDLTPEGGEAEQYIPLEGMVVVAAQNIPR